MKIITEPRVHVLSVPTFFPHPDYQVPEHPFPAERLIAHAGKGCYDSYGLDGRSVQDHIISLLDSKHYSVLEHANFSLWVDGISRGLSHELVRHRHFSYSQRSTRYTDEKDAAVVLDPDYADLYVLDQADAKSLTHLQRAILDSFVEQFRSSLVKYKVHVDDLIRWNPHGLTGKDLRKWARGKARQMLPHSLETRVTVTGNIRSWNEFFTKRHNPAAEAEIRRLAGYIYDTLRKFAPNAIRLTE